MIKVLSLGLIAAGILVTGQAPANAADSSSDKPLVRCIDITRMKSSKVIDNRTIILNMRGGPDYKMTLAHRCPGLKSQGTWRHDARSLAKLCEVDTIEVPVTTSGNVLDNNFTPCIIESITELPENGAKAQ
ncbi:DUF6491 family protein [Iodidimonas sp. SYSU 1G8]|uniref:DUF6491 family protein n=1 Tax=Iodidimonas sp. SYSU 1G8 TaxID=3133967 RepID=UPI0031FF2548